MQVHSTYKELSKDARGAALVIGNFDGVHRGHAKVIARGRDIATSLVAPLGVMAFEPHPREFFAPNAPPFRLTMPETRARLLERHGVDLAYILPFDKALATMEARDFVTEVLVAGLGVVHVVVGYDFCFGKGRKGDAALLKSMGAELGFGVTVIEPVREGGDETEVFSSTRIRDALRDGHPELAAKLLGHWWTIEGEVKKGDQIGRTMGFPTVNVDLGRYLHPKYGIYVVKVEVLNGPHAGTYDGAASMGWQPTFKKDEPLFEAFLIDFDGDLYGAELAVSLIAYLRPEEKYEGLEELKAAIEADVAQAKSILAALRAHPESVPWADGKGQGA
jgi:riboflavin kinase/FMN adenylyltransferase